MEDKENSNFCSGCGAPLRDSDTFCASCGTTRGGSANTTQYGNPKPKSHTLVVAAVLSIIWALIALGLGIYFTLWVDSLMDLINSTPEYLEILNEYGITTSDMSSVLYMIGAVLIASGLFAAISAALCLMKKFYIVALIMCILASVLVITALVGIVGLIVAYLIYKGRDEFAVSSPR
ncbi:MAG: zinc ribbon domain-containing protein [Candidatus Methanoplasma sp.]|jgi:hypothetical protein|nr:zinc ribbon domain-containing protein [Candidatus Methanoplasma sp.]